ncbi:hypothetical protein [Salininema proteolyticum]|uniref:Lipoprotein n=1 Tax=Salininema proteolyticum TaxID=1607685 RepID=A0ABV8TXY9_9ACTN
MRKLLLPVALLPLTLTGCTESSEPEGNELDFTLVLQTCFESADSEQLECGYDLPLDGGEASIDCGGVTVWEGTMDNGRGHATYEGEGECVITIDDPLLTEPFERTFEAGHEVGFNVPVNEFFIIRRGDPNEINDRTEHDR